MTKLSLKLGIIFFLTLFCMEALMMFFLHASLATSRVEEELISLQARGNAHRTILERNFDQETLAHVALMESEASTDVVITDDKGNILASSQPLIHVQQYVNSLDQSIPYKGQILEANWREEAFIATISPITDGQIAIGYVFMFQNTDSVHALMQRLNKHFLIVGLISGVVAIMIIIILSRRLAHPLLQMKEAALKMSKGDFTVALATNGQDELSDLSNAIQRLADDLQYMKQERNEFLSSIAHELRTPLTFIKGYTDILYKRSLSEADQHKYLMVIIEETNRLSRLIKDLFDLAKMEEHSFIIEKEWIEMPVFLANLEAKWRPAFQNKQIQLQIHSQETVRLMADASRLEQIMINLLDNALKYCQAGDTTEVNVQQMNQTVQITIQDTGKGIPQHDLPYIFDRFYRVEKSRSRALGGSGLGLAIVKELVHAHEGTITVHSEEQRGTIFELTFRGVANDENIVTD